MKHKKYKDSSKIENRGVEVARTMAFQSTFCFVVVCLFCFLIYVLTITNGIPNLATCTKMFLQ